MGRLMRNCAHKKWRSHICGLGMTALLVFSGPAMGQTIRGPADVNRIRVEDRVTLPSVKEQPQAVDPPRTPIPSVTTSNLPKFILKNLSVTGVTVFPESEIAEIYAPFINQPVTLDTAQQIAGAITEKYRIAGYFLSVASVMQEGTKNGSVAIKVVEGYIGEVEMTGEMANLAVVREHIEQLQQQRPVSSKAIESFLLRLNDLPGYSFRAVLAQSSPTNEASVKLILVPAERSGQGSVTIDNYGSRFLGPNEVIASYSTSILPLMQTNLTVISSIGDDELRSGNLEHSYAIAPDWTIGLQASITNAAPGFTLEPFEIQSDSIALGGYTKYQWIRQRDENLALKLTFDGRHSTTDVLGVPFMRDDIRALRLNAAYDLADSWHGISIANVTVSKGIEGLGSSREGDLNLSRAQAEPDFTKVELNVTRLQNITEQWSLQLGFAGQVANGPLFAAEEFGYGGQAFGRAFDASEITGDHGFSSSAELRYEGWELPDSLRIQPFAFYDIGVVWNDDIAQDAQESGSSAGAGVRLNTDWGVNGTLGAAFPLTRPIINPIYGADRDGPRFMFQLNKSF